MEKLDWIPLYVYRLVDSEAWTLPDYKFGWFMKILVKLVTSTTPGYLPNDIDVLWQVAGARTKAYFQREGQSVLDRYFKRTTDMRWIYNERMLETISKQTKKLTRPPSPSLSLSLGGISVGFENQEFNSAESARLVMDHLGLYGNRNHQLAMEAIDGAAKRFGLTPQLAAETITTMWDEYQSLEGIQYKVGKKKFLEEGYWDKSMWVQKGGREDAIRRAIEELE